jgi:hypothetical protein
VTPEQIWTSCRREHFLPMPGIGPEFLGFSGRIPAAVLTTLSWYFFKLSKSKVKFTLEQAMEAQWRNRGMTLLFL